ncbi:MULTISPECIES: hypothetical protein [unclassified Mesorhizobium]|uniref:hypothetical protein n=1 Tax=unclassified Mesorhizobium TaxID=325217 RepID=UPI000BAE72E5|nr:MULTISPECIES: hypothetical protein [unclassified Mesorhizobium]TGT59911.1 hypothetical protein EN813_025330 [Mesorhizobium sp. M00.F.Ca.ET.170.01.1.1]AZO08068.1 hypothetical protein EJ074_02230 [Mesorhizobium sp. M3A.F.Ca.ET.080.04.2.1]PBB86984.1 hypothetical protein CK216_08390 [Mesorhizobium sp. WSM3876]RWB70345.1 MAG: hypothetical protein EOQ49_18580 [Mesorhizobium sp.]RWB91410.1 MAG: hypothetical protein EOQ52_08310 [Mesorhizobium sp.]
MRKFMLSLAMFGVASMPAAAQSIGGAYTVAGTNFDGSNYGGEATITLTSDTTCTIHWETGGSTSDGICMRNDDAFSAGYVMGKEIGLVVYKVEKDGSLHGLWTIAGQNGNGTEVLTPK